MKSSLFLRNGKVRLCMLISALVSTCTLAQPIDFSTLQNCTLDSNNLSKIEDPNHSEFPCILHDIQPNTSAFDDIDQAESLMSVVTIVQVTPHSCKDHRDGSATAIESFNAENNNKGIEIGFTGGYYVQFRFVSVVAGIDENDGVYEQNHSDILEGMLDSNELDAKFIIGTCSFASRYERDIAESKERILMAQVGPDSYYHGGLLYNFGIHVSSLLYAVSSLKIINFRTPGQFSVAVFGRSQSEFFNTTCSSAVDYANENGIALAIDNAAGRIVYDPQKVDNTTFIKDVAKQVCESGADYYVGCVNEEAQDFLDTWKEMGCKPKGVWLTCATWTDFLTNIDRPYILGAGQWHYNFPYADEYFSSGADLLYHNEIKFGYQPDYNTVASYTAAYVFMSHVIELFRLDDEPNRTFVDTYFVEQYELNRRTLRRFSGDTIFGRVIFDSDLQRNVGREPATSQWDQDINGNIIDQSISPLDVASMELRFPAFTAEPCPLGSFANHEELFNQANPSCFLCEQCSSCPVDTYSNNGLGALNCLDCPSGTSTDGLTGQARCIEVQDSLFDDWTIAITISAVSINYVLIICFLVWIHIYRRSKVVVFSQFNFLKLICIGALISTSAIIPLTIEGISIEVLDNQNLRNFACMATPWMYAIGWILTFSALFTKSWRLGKIVNNQEMRIIRVRTRFLLLVIASLAAVASLPLIVWTIRAPLKWERYLLEENEKDNVLTRKYLQSCTSDENVWLYVWPLLLIALVVLLVGNYILYKVRNVNSLFQERKWISISLFGQAEMLLLAVPILIARDPTSPTSSYLIVAMLIFINDCAVLLLIFAPKIYAVKYEGGDQDYSDYLKGGGFMSDSDGVIAHKPRTPSKIGSKFEGSKFEGSKFEDSDSSKGSNKVFSVSDSSKGSKVENISL